MSTDRDALLTDDDLRALWRSAGGGFHGPHVEHGYMEEDKLLPFLRSLALATPAGAQGAWQPIETAPKDGREILCTWFPPLRDSAAYREPMHVLSWWPEWERRNGQRGCWVLDGDFASRFDPDDVHDTPPLGKDPTHWQPLPSPPNASPTAARPADGAEVGDLEGHFLTLQNVAGHFRRNDGVFTAEAIEEALASFRAALNPRRGGGANG